MTLAQFVEKCREAGVLDSDRILYIDATLTPRPPEYVEVDVIEVTPADRGDGTRRIGIQAA